MALFKRPDLKAQGLTDEQIDYIMTEANRSLSKNYVLTSDVQGQIDAAKAEWEKGQTVPDPDAERCLQGAAGRFQRLQADAGGARLEGLRGREAQVL